MALVHEKLYQSEDMVSVDFADYIQNLADYLLQSYSLGDMKISLKLDVEKVFLGMDTAVPLGIIINELISNSLKHAFINGHEGEIYIKLQSSGECTSLHEESSRNTENKMSGNRNSETAGSRKATKNKRDKLTLIVRDNGIGFPEKLDFRETTSLGLQLVTNLVDQIDGNIEIDTTAGTEFKISFFRG
jgi:two-component sensor histidine kinase